MTRNEDIPLRETLASDVVEQAPNDLEQEVSNLDQADLRQRESSRKRARVLVGSAIVQLPIWGRLGILSWFHSTHQSRLYHELRRFPRILF